MMIDRLIRNRLPRIAVWCACLAGMVAFATPSWSAHAATGKSASADPWLVYIGTYTRRGSKGIYVYRMDPNAGTLTPVATASGVTNPSFVAVNPSHRNLYAVSEAARFKGKPSGAVAAFSIDPDSGKLARINAQSSGGAGPCFVAVDHAGKHLLVANYGSGSVAVLPIRADGGLGEATAFIQHHGASVHARQKGPHAHAIYADAHDQFVIVPDLGMDKLMIYQYDAKAGTLKPNPAMPFARLTPPSGPRHFAFHPSGEFGYVINEIASTITAFRYAADRGTLATLQTVSTLPADFQGKSTTAEIVVSADGRFVYGSNRGDDSIVVFAVNAKTGKLTFVSRHETQGHTPRNFAIDPSGRFLLAANQDTDNIVVFRVDRSTGMLTPTGHQIQVPAPVCVLVVPARED